jgi:uncharacterized membrane protein YjgN (DUF898 family)
MNNLSIVIYLADIIPSLGGLFAFLTIVSVAIMAISGLAYFINRSDHLSSLKYGHERSGSISKSHMMVCAKIFRSAMVVFLIAVIPCIVIPKRDTIMMIAASEFGETALKSDDVREIVNPAKQILKNWINDQLAQSEKKK